MWRFLLFLVGLAATFPLSAQELNLRHTLACVARHLVFSPDGKTLASVGHSGEITLWDLATGKSTDVPTGHEGKAWPVAFSPDSRTLALVKKDGTIEVRDLASGKNVAILDGHADRVFAVAFSPDGKIVASGGERGQISLWDIATGKIIASYKEDAAKYFGVTSLAFSSDGKFLASTVDGIEVELWDLRTGTGTVMFHTKSMQGYDLAGVAFSPDSQTLAVAGCLIREWIQLWSVPTTKKTITLAGHKPCGVHSFAFRSDSKTIISIGFGDGKVKVWDIVTGENIATLGGLSEEVINGSYERTFSPDGRMLALLMSEDKSIRIFDVKAGREAAK